MQFIRTIKTEIFRLLKASKRNHLTSHAASISFFTIFSVPPLIIIVIFIADLLVDDKVVTAYLFQTITEYLNPNIAGDIKEAVSKAQYNSKGLLSSMIGFALLVWSSNSIFLHFKRGLQVVFESDEINALNMKQKIWDFLSSLAVIGTLGLLVMLFVLADIGLSVIDLKSTIESYDKMGWLPYLFQAFSFITHAWLFFMFYKMLGKTGLDAKTLFVGAAFASLFFTFGKSFLLNFLVSSRWSNVYGAAGNFVIFLLWMYYNAFIVLLGAQIAQTCLPRKHVQNT